LTGRKSLRDALEKFHPTPSQEGAGKDQEHFSPTGLDEYAVSLKQVMDPVWQREFFPTSWTP